MRPTSRADPAASAGSTTTSASGEQAGEREQDQVEVGTGVLHGVGPFVDGMAGSSTARRYQRSRCSTAEQEAQAHARAAGVLRAEGRGEQAAGLAPGERLDGEQPQRRRRGRQVGAGEQVGAQVAGRAAQVVAQRARGDVGERLVGQLARVGRGAGVRARGRADERRVVVDDQAAGTVAGDRDAEVAQTHPLASQSHGDGDAPAPEPGRAARRGGRPAHAPRARHRRLKTRAGIQVASGERGDGTLVRGGVIAAVAEVRARERLRERRHAQVGDRRRSDRRRRRAQRRR